MSKKRSLSTEEDCVPEYKFGDLVGIGAYSRVFNACDKKSSSAEASGVKRYKVSASVAEGKTELKEKCDSYIIKESDVANYNYYVSALIDIGMLKRLQSVMWTNSMGEKKYLVPRIFRNIFCEKKAFLVMEKWDTDMQKVGQKQFREILSESARDFPPYVPSDNDLFFTNQQLTDMFNIAKRMDELGIVEGDLKPSQFLYNPNTGAMVVTDFGLSGVFGWTSNTATANCPEIWGKENSIVPKDLREYFNQWQLMSSLTDYSTTFTFSPTENSIVIFGGISGIPLIWKIKLVDICKGAKLKAEIKEIPTERKGEYYIPAAAGWTERKRIIPLQYLKELYANVGKEGGISERYFNDKLAEYLEQASPVV